jgi:alkanesulfonate monooxygenase SsuD/methylene tetrahydromethanopterin reductase-like flavin-dependent oxidoreductase (luciferase family)
MVRCDTAEATQLGARRANVARCHVFDAEFAAGRRRQIRELAEAEGRDPDSVRVLADITVALSFEADNAKARRDMAEEMLGGRLGGDGARYVGTPEGLADHMCDWLEAGACDGFTVIPTSLPVDLVLLVDAVVPELQARGCFPTEYAVSGTSSLAARRSARRRVA